MRVDYNSFERADRNRHPLLRGGRESGDREHSHDCDYRFAHVFVTSSKLLSL
jgi:hypothetical protein